MDRIETLVIGAGVVGLAVARELAMSGRDVILLEQGGLIGSGISSRNSEVIHAGLYYEPGSLKARLCVEGRAELYAYCASRGVAHRRCEKLIVATDDQQIAGLEKIARRALAAGVGDLRWLEAREAMALEPALRCVRALHSPSTGIVDSHGLMLSLQGEAEDHGAMLALESRFLRASVESDGIRVEVASGSETTTLVCTELVNCAGLNAVAVARGIEGLADDHVPDAFLAKGNYFALVGRTPFTRLIYPIPSEAGLGVHLTLDLAGQGKFGPDVEWVGTEDYTVDPSRADGFYDEIRRYWPGLADRALVPAYAGIRPKIVGPDAAAADFRIDGPTRHGVPGLVNLFGIESPGLTSSLALAREARRVLEARGG